MSAAAAPRADFGAIGRFAMLGVPVTLFLLALALRVTNLLAFDPFGDEVGWLEWVLDFFNPGDPATLWTPLTVEGRPPLYFWLLLFLGEVDPNLFVGGRLAAALASAGVTPVIYGIGRSLWSTQVGIVAALLWVVLPFGVLFGRFASSDDALMALFFGLTVWCSVGMARRPGIVIGALAGVAAAMAIMSKTIGLLSLVAPGLAILILGDPLKPRRWAPSVGGFGLAFVLAMAPLLQWFSSMVSKANQHVAIDVEDRYGNSALNRPPLERFLDNAAVSADYLAAYLGIAVLVLAALGLGVGVARRDRPAMFLGLTICAGIFPVLVLTTTLYSRYLLFISIPLLLLAAVGIVTIYGWLRGELASGPVRAHLRAPVTAALCVAALLGALATPLTLTRAVVLEPRAATLPDEDDWRYFRHRWSLVGFTAIQQILIQESRVSPVTVILPRDGPEFRFKLPYDALRQYARGTPGLRFDDVPPLRDGTPPRAYREISDGQRPTYLLVNDIDPNLPDQTNPRLRVHQRIRQSFPLARLVRTSPPRPDGYVLSLYRLDRGGGS